MKLKRCFPKISVGILLVIVVFSVFANIIAPYDPSIMNSNLICMPPNKEHIFGTDTLGRDLFSMILYGGRASLYIGFVSAIISSTIAIVYGAASGLTSQRKDNIMMRFVELLLSIPSILLVIFLQGALGQPTFTSISIVIGVTNWMNIAKVVRSEVRQIGSSEYILAANTMGAGFFYTLRKHILSNCISAIMFMIVTNIGQAIIIESTLSFLGLGLPLTIVSWGSLLSMSQDVLLTNCWWIIIIPGAVLIITIVCVTEIGEYIRKKNNRLYSNL